MLFFRLQINSEQLVDEVATSLGFTCTIYNDASDSSASGLPAFYIGVCLFNSKAVPLDCDASDTGMSRFCWCVPAASIP